MPLEATAGVEKGSCMVDKEERWDEGHNLKAEDKDPEVVGALISDLKSTIYPYCLKLTLFHRICTVQEG